MAGPADNYIRGMVPGATYNPFADMPEYPTFIGMEPGDLTLFGRSPLMNKYGQEAGRTGPSPAALMAMREQNRLYGLSRDQLKKQALGEAAQAKTALAMKGGLQSGAGERINTSMGNRALELAQTTHAANNKNIADIGMEDEQARTKMLGNAAAMEGDILSGDVQRKQLENTKGNAFNLGRYDSKMKAWAADKQAKATENSGKK